MRRRGIDIATAADQGLLGASDAQHLERAIRLQSVVVTSDYDYLKLAHERVEQGLSHSGVMFILPQTRVGEAVRAIALVAQVLDPKEMEGWVEWVP